MTCIFRILTVALDSCLGPYGELIGEETKGEVYEFAPVEESKVETEGCMSMCRVSSERSFERTSNVKKYEKKD